MVGSACGAGPAHQRPRFWPAPGPGSGPGSTTITVGGLAPERVVALLTASALSFSEVSADQASLVEAYMELARDQVEYRLTDVGGVER
jgi:ABC-2 type transport system ATP-binding protein